MHMAAEVLADIFLMFLVARLAGEIFERLRQPPVVGELLAGVLIGPFALGLIGTPGEGLIHALHDPTEAALALSAIYDVIAELGVVVLLFVVGLETRLSDILRVGARAGIVAVAGVVLPFLLGYAFAAAVGKTSIEALFIATSLVATSVGITARVLADLGTLHSVEARIILGAAVIDDVLAMIVLAVVSALGQTGTVSIASIGLIAAQAIGFTAFVALAGRHAVTRWSANLERLRLNDAPFVVAMLAMLGLAALAAQIGLAAIIGAFLAGMVFAELREQYELERKARPLYELLVPLFFVITGSRVDWRVFLDAQVLGLALAVTALAIVGKLVACGLSAWGLAGRSMAIVGVGMAPRGEVGLIVANIGMSLGAISGTTFSIVVIMSLLTTIVVPPALTALYNRRPEEIVPDEDDDLHGLLHGEFEPLDEPPVSLAAERRENAPPSQHRASERSTSTLDEP
ncbi:MAG: cation:proton antiporter [Chloroflexi bacterium]|nr:cation:proton antiporter [Chloroflexota bacterium]